MGHWESMAQEKTRQDLSNAGRGSTGVPRNADFGDFGTLIPARAEGCAPPTASFAAGGRKQFSSFPSGFLPGNPDPSCSSGSGADQIRASPGISAAELCLSQFDLSLSQADF